MSKQAEVFTGAQAKVWVAIVAGIVAIVVAYFQFGPALFAAQVPTVTLTPGPTSIPTPATPYTVRVIDVTTKQPAWGAKVSLEAQDVPPVGYTDSEGVYQFQIDYPNVKQIRVKVEAYGYEQFDRIVTLTPTPQLEDIRLQPIQTSLVPLPDPGPSSGPTGGTGSPTPPLLPTLPPISASSCVELLSQPLVLEVTGANVGQTPAEENLYPDARVLQGKQTVRIGYDLHGGFLTSGDASAFAFVKTSLWYDISLSDFVENGTDGERTIVVPLTSFRGLTPGMLVDSLHVRIWSDHPVQIELLSIAVCG